MLSSWFWLGPFREPESQIQRQKGDHQLAMYYRYLQLEGAKKIRRLYSAILWVWMGCPIFTKCLDNHWIPESSLGPTDKRVDRGGECHISEPEKNLCRAFQKPVLGAIPCPLQPVGLLSLIWPQWHTLLRWGKGISANSSFRAVRPDKVSVDLCKLFRCCLFSIYSNRCQLLLFSASNQLSWRYLFV